MSSLFLGAPVEKEEEAMANRERKSVTHCLPHGGSESRNFPAQLEEAPKELLYKDR